MATPLRRQHAERMASLRARTRTERGPRRHASAVTAGSPGSGGVHSQTVCHDIGSIRDSRRRVHSRSVHPFGSATLDPASSHYADQAPLFARGELKPVWLDEAEIRAHLEREYRPGEGPGR